MPASTISRWYFFASVGSSRRAWLALMNNASRSRASSSLMVRRASQNTPEESSDGTSPLNPCTAASDVKRLAWPSRLRMTAPVTRHGCDDASWVPIGDQHGDPLVDLLNPRGKGEREASFDGDVFGPVWEVELVDP